MEEAIELARGKDAKQRMAAIERLHHLLESSAKPLSASETTSIVECCLDLSKDSNFRVCQHSLQSLASAVVLSGDNSKFHFNAIVPVVVERLGDGKQPVRDASRSLLLTLMQVSSPTIIVERAGSYAWMHKNWRVREEFARTVTSAIGLFASTELPLQRAILPPILQMLNDTNLSVREAAMSCIEGMYAQGGVQFRDELQRHHLPVSMVKEINARLERIQPKGSSDGWQNVKHMNFNPKKGSAKAKSGARDVSLCGAESDIAEQPVEPLKVFSEKELIREFDKIAATLVPEKDWSLRVASMKRMQALVLGGAADYPCFIGLLKQLIGPLSTQLSDRRSSIVKQACHLLCFLSKELVADFEACAEMFIPVLFKLVVITVLVIAESADNCIKTMLRNCKVSRVLPRIADCAMNDHSAVLRARCCEYALLILEQWPDAPEIQRSADLYEELIRRCVSDAMSEVRSTARMCYRMFSKTWPEHSQHLFSSFDPSIQKIVKEENGVSHRQHAYSSVRDRSAQISSSRTFSHTVLPGYGTSAIVAMDRSSTLNSGTSLSSGLLLSETKSLGKGADSSLQSVLHTSKEKVSAIEIMLRGLDVSKHNQSAFQSSSLDLGKRSEKLQQVSSVEESYDTRGGRRFTNMHMDRQHLDYSSRDGTPGDFQSAYVPNFQRPLSRKPVAGRTATRRRSSFDESQLSMMNVSSFVEGPASLTDALSEGLSPRSNWSARVASFNYIQSLLQQGPKGIQEVLQSFDKVMKLFFQHLDDPHHKVAQAALSTLAEIIPSCRKPFENYMDRMLPHVFSRLVDPKELVRQSCKAALEVVNKSYSVDSLLTALLRSIDEQRSPKAKLAVIEFAVDSFNKYAINSEGSGNSGILKLWLAKLTPLTCDKNTKLKEAAISCIISVYSHFDSMAVLNFILSLSIDEQNSLRRALKQNTPRIEVDLMNFLQSKKECQRSKSTYDSSDITTGSYEEDYVGLPKKSNIISRYSAGSVKANSGRWWVSSQDSSLPSGDTIIASHDIEVDRYPDAISPKILDLKYMVDPKGQSLDPATAQLGNLQNEDTGSSTSHLANGHGREPSADADLDVNQPSPLKISPSLNGRLSVPQILHLVSNGNDAVASSNKWSGLQHLIEMSQANDFSVMSKYFNQILSTALDVLDDSDSSNRELGLLLIFEILKNQQDMIQDSVEIVIEKLLHMTKDTVAKVSNEAEKCLISVTSQYDPLRCLSVIAPLLVTEDEKTLVNCIKCLTKLVGRLSPEELMGQLPSFLPSLFEAFGNQSPDVRKTVVSCLVDMYIMLGKAFLPHLKGLNSTQLRLVTLYANRISQARTGSPVETNV